MDEAGDGNGHAAADGPSDHDQAGIASTNAQQSRLARGRHASLDGVLCLPEWGHVKQVMGGCDAGEVNVEVTGGAGGIHEAVFALHRDRIGEVHNEGVKDRRFPGHAQPLGHRRGCGFPPCQMHHGMVRMTARGHAHHAVVHLARRESASAAVAERLGVAREAAVFHTLIVHFADAVPVQCEDRFVNPACAPGYLDVDFTRITPTHYLLDVAPLWEAQYSIEAGVPTAREARLLGIGRRDPCLIVVRRTVSRSVPITVARLVHPGTRYLLHGEFKP